MSDIRILVQADPFQPSVRRYVVCEFLVDRRDYKIVSNHPSRQAAYDWLVESGHLPAPSRLRPMVRRSHMVALPKSPHGAPPVNSLSLA